MKRYQISKENLTESSALQKRLLPLLAFTCAMLLFGAEGAVLAQGATGMVSFTAVDAKGNPVADVTVTLFNTERAFTYTNVTNKKGYLMLRFVDKAPYQVEAKKGGFKIIKVEYKALAGSPEARMQVLSLGRKLEDTMEVGPSQKLFQDFYVSPGVQYEVTLVLMAEKEATERWAMTAAAKSGGIPKPPTPEERLAKALEEALEKTTTFPAAIEHIKAAMGVNFVEGDAAHQLASRYEMSGKTALAREAYVHAAPLKSSAELWVRAAWLAREAGEFSGAVTAYEKALALDARLPDALGGLAYTYEKMGKKADAAAKYAALAAADPANSAAWERLVVLYTDMKQHGKAAEANKKLQALAPQGEQGASGPAPVDLYNQGALCLNQGDKACAEKSFLAAVQADAAYSAAHYQLAMLYMNSGKCGKAVPHFEAFLKKPDAAVGDAETVKALLDYCKTQK